MSFASSTHASWPSSSASELAHALGPTLPKRPANGRRALASAHDNPETSQPRIASTGQAQKESDKEYAHAQFLQSPNASSSSSESKATATASFAFVSPRSATAHELRYLRESNKQIRASASSTVLFPGPETTDSDSVTGTIAQSSPPLTWATSGTDPDRVSSTPPASETPKGGGYHGLTEEEMDEADRNFRAGLGWFVSSHALRRSEDSRKPGELPPGMSWARSWLDAPRADEPEPINHDQEMREAPWMLEDTSEVAEVLPLETLFACEALAGAERKESNAQSRFAWTEADAMALAALEGRFVGVC